MLSIDTTFDNVSIAFSKDASTIDSFINLKKLSSAEVILTSLNFFLLKNNLSFDNIDEFVFTNGPASFIKIRIGITVAKALSFLLKNAKFYTINHFQIYDFLIKKEIPANAKHQFIALYGYGDIFYCQYSQNGVIIFQKALKLHEIYDFLMKNNVDCVVCDGKFSEFEEKNNINIKIYNFSNKIDNCAEIALRAFQNLEEKNEKIEPFYLITPIFKTIKQ